jgi:hypothetical protein
MNLTNLLYEPYTIILIISIIITIITYFIVQSDNKDKEEEHQTNLGTSLLYTFLGSFIGMTILKFGISYLNNNNFFQKGGSTNSNYDKLTHVGDDVEFDIMET